MGRAAAARAAQRSRLVERCKRRGDEEEHAKCRTEGTENRTVLVS